MSTEEKKNSQISLDSETLSPSTEKEVSEIVREIYLKKLPIEITGTGTKKVFGYNLQTAKKLSLSQLSGIIDYQKEELYIKVKAGTPVSTMDLTWAQKQAIHDDTAAADLKSAGKYVESKDQ